MVRRVITAFFFVLICATLATAQAQGPVFTEYATPTSSGFAIGLVNGPDGALWLAGDQKIWRFTPGSSTGYSVGPNFVASMTVGPDGAIWFSQGGQISKITTAGTITQFTAIPGVTEISSMVTGPDGAVWFTEDNQNKIGRITTAGAITEYPLASSFPEKRPLSIAVGSDGALWFTESGGNAIGRITTGGSLTEYPLPTAFSNPGTIAAGSDGALWFTEPGSYKIGRITTGGTITEFPILTTNAPPYYITSGPDGALWFSQYQRISRITTAGVINEYVLPRQSNNPHGLVTGPDGALWYIEGPHIGKFEPNGTVGGGTLVQAFSAQGTNIPAVSARIGGTTAGNLLIAVVRMGTASQSVTVTDTLGNTFVQAVAQTQDQNSHQIRIFYAANIAGGADTVTATFPTNNDHSWLSLYEYAGIQTTNPLDQIARAQGFGASVSTGNTPTTTASNELLFAATGQEGATYDPIQPGPGFVLRQADSGNSRAATESTVVTATGTYAGTFSTSDVHIWSAALATFKASGPPIAPTITSSSLPRGSQNATYVAGLGASGGVGPYRWAVVSGSLPAGVTLNSDWGQLQGNPTNPGSSSFTLQLTDGNSLTATRSFTIDVDIQSPTVNPDVTLLDGRVGSPYTGTLRASGGSAPYSWSVASGSLPQGLTLNPDGTITGTPTFHGISNFIAQATDSRSQTGTRNLSITVFEWIEETSSAIVRSGTWYPNSSAAHSGGSAIESIDPGSRVTFSFTGTGVSWIGLKDEYSGIANVYLDGSLVATVDAYSAAGRPRVPLYTVLGLPNTTHTISIEATGTRDAFSASSWIWVDAFRTLGPTGTGSVYPAITATSLPMATQNTPYSAQLTATGGTTPYTFQAFVSGGLPAGLTLNQNTGVISGTPTTSVWKEFTGVVVDSSPRQSSASFSITIQPNNNPPLSMTTSSLPDGTTGTAYSQTLAATGGREPYTWSISSGNAPPGLGLSAGGVLSGTPNTVGTFSFDIRVTDSASAQATRNFSVVVSDGNPLRVTTNSMPNGRVSLAYSGTFLAAGGQSPYTWAVTSGGLPPGLWVDPDTGAVSGTPTARGLFTFTIQVADSLGAHATKNLFIDVSSAPPTPNSLVVTTTSLPGGTRDTAYTAHLQATGGEPPYTWAIITGSLPTGLTLNTGTGAITGTPTGTGTSTFTVRATDTGSREASKALSITIGSSAQPPTITTNSMPGGRETQPYSGTIQATGGQTPYTWAITSGSLPPGLTLNTSTGVVSGTPTLRGAYPFTARVTDSLGAEATKSLFINIDRQFTPDPLSITTTSLPDGTQGVSYSASLQAAGGEPPYTWAIAAGSLPAGLTLNTSTGAITGTPTAAGTSNFTVHVTDTGSREASKALSITIRLPLQIQTASAPTAFTNRAYSLTFQASGGQVPYTWSLASGNIPPGYTMGSGGTLSGTTSSAGTYSFVIRVRDGAGTEATKSFQLTVVEPEPPPSGDPTLIQDSDSAVAKSDGWYSLSRSFFNGGSAIEAIDPGSRATVTFNGTGVTWIGYQDEYSGIARVYLDGSAIAIVDTYGPATTNKRFYTISGLASGTHTLAIEVTGTRNAGSASSWIWVDAFEIVGSGGGSPPPPPPPPPPPSGGSPYRIEQNDASITYSGSWATNGGGFNSGGSAVLSTDPNDSTTVQFTGTGIQWIGYSDEWSGIAQVYVDGVLRDTVDTYRSPSEAQRTEYAVSGLSSGSHTFRIVVTGTQNPSSAQAWVWVDAFVIQP